MKSSVWISRYQLGDEVHRQRRFADIERLAVPLKLSNHSPVAGAELLKAQLKAIYLCSEQIIRILIELLDLAAAHCEFHFSSPQRVARGLYEKFPWGETPTIPAILLTGLAGIGKTELLNALCRLLDLLKEDSTVDLPGHKRIPLVPAWLMTLRSGSGLNSLILPWLEQPSDCPESSRKKDLKIPELLGLARRVAYRDAVCMLGVDEFQFITGSNSNAKANNLLMQLLGIGPRLVYCANYSLVHSLKKRRQEDRQRLLAHRIQLRPEPTTSTDGIRLLKEYFKVAPEDFTFDASNVAEQIQDYTYGIKRAEAELLGGAWLRAKSSRGRRAQVTSDDLRWAYLDHETNRVDVEILQRQDIQGEMIREDLWDPFYMPPDRTNVVEAKLAIEAFEQRVEDKRTQSFLTPDERRGWEAIQKMKKPPKEKASNVVPMKSGKRNKEDLAEALRLMEE